MSRHDLTDTEWAQLAPLLPPPTKMGRPRRCRRTLLNGMLWILRTGAPWRDLPEEFGPWKTVYHRFNAWRKDGLWQKIHFQLLTELHQKGRLDHELWCIDGTSIRAQHSAAGGAPKGGTSVLAAPVEAGAASSTSSVMAMVTP